MFCLIIYMIHPPCELRYTLVSRISKRTCTPYLISTKLPPCTLLFGTASLSIFLDFCQIFRPNLDFFWKKLGIFSKIFLIINYIASFYPVLQYFNQNFTLYAYLIFVKIPPCTLIRETTGWKKSTLPILNPKYLCRLLYFLQKNSAFRTGKELQIMIF